MTTAPALAAVSQPHPAPGRWRPLRIGLVDLFHYDVEEFRFRDGRLLLRGNNGTGKSKVLALTLPFLLDGDLSARRVEPDGDPGKRMEWNLLLGGEHPHPERLGYTWIEFGRLDTDTGEAHFRTLLCGLKAVSGRGVARHWFAVTEQRIGDGLELLDATRTALSRDRLAEAIGEHGRVYDTAKAYRRAVDEALFGLGEQRYAALVDLLIQLRQPQLSKRPNEAALSRALTEALPPMDQAVIADVAEAFRSLDEEKQELRAAGEAERAATAFLDHYRRYAKVAARRRARLPRSEHSRYEQLLRDLAHAEAEREEATSAREAAQREGDELEERGVRLAAEEQALRAGPEMRDARELDRAADDAARTARDTARARADAAEAARSRTRAEDRLATAAERLSGADRERAAVRADVRGTAIRARLAEDLATADLPVAELRRDTEQAVERRERTLVHVQELRAVAERAEAERAAARRRGDEAQQETVHAAERQAEAEADAERAGQILIAAVRDHLAGCAELTGLDLPGLLDALQPWVSSLDGPGPAGTAAAAAHRARAAVFADHTAALTARRTELLGARREAERELAGLEAGGQVGPPAPYTRGERARETADGAPLWRLVDFREHLSDAERAGLEAALEVAGLLDAWVLPDGALLSADRSDLLLHPPSQLLPDRSATLASALRFAADPADTRAATVSEEAATRLLASIGYGPGGEGEAEHSTWVAADGRFRNGALTGAWSKPQARYLGEGTREATRRTRIAALRSELQALEADLTDVERELREIAERRTRLDTEFAALPGDDALRQAHARTAAAADIARRARTRQAERDGELATATADAEAAWRDLDRTAADVGLSADPDGLATVRRALSELRARLAALWPVLRECADARTGVAAEQEEAARTAAREGELAARAAEAARRAAAADARHATLQATVGEAVATLQKRLAETATAIEDCRTRLRTTAAAVAEADRAAARAEGRGEQLSRDVAEAVDLRERAIAALRRFADTGLLAVALPGVSVPEAGAGGWAVTPAIGLARAMEAELSTVDDSDSVWERVQRRLSEEFTRLQDALSRHGHTAAAYPGEDGMRVEIVYQGREHAVPELAEALRIEVAELTRILSAHEREILETHLITEVAGTLQELIVSAERRVRAMNAELEQRPTSTGMTLRLVWRDSRHAPEGLGLARERLRQAADAWSPADRDTVGGFLQAQIARRQAEDTAGGWLETLTGALDYRAWHEFGVERHQGGKWVPATGPASGGERVLAVSVPLFAAASAHYASAGSPHAPRLITLDEAFAGVDDDARAKCLGLLHAFDLDVVMTSEREWACYPQVPGIAIAQLSRVDGIPAVLVSRWEWDGTRRARGADPRPEPEPEPEPAAGPDAADGQWK